MFGEWLHNLSQPELRGLFDSLDLTITYDPGRRVARMFVNLPQLVTGAPLLREIRAPEMTGGDRPIGGSGASTHMGNAPARGRAVAGRRRGVVQPAATLLE